MSVHDELDRLREQRDEVIRRGFESGELEPCNMTVRDPYTPGYICHRGGIGCTLEHEDDPLELRRIERRSGRKSSLERVLGR